MSIYAQQVDLKELGLKFILPEGWTGQEQGEYMLCGHQTIPGLMVLLQNTSENAEHLKNLALQGIMDEGVYLQPKGNFNLISPQRVEGFYEGNFQGASVTAFAIGLINGKGAGMSIIILTENDKFGDVHISEAKKLAQSVEFSQPVDEGAARWKNKIVGMKLKYMHTSGGSDYSGGYSGISDTRIINLFRDGTFNYYSNSHSSFDSSGGFGHVNSNKSNHGRYEIYSSSGETYLDLNFTDGEVYSYALSTNEQGNTFLNGSRYFVVDLD